MHVLTDAKVRPYMRPRWLKVDPHRAQISVEFMIWCEQRGIVVVASAGKANKQQGTVEYHAQLFELMLEDVVADVQPQTEYEWRECLDALPEAKNSLLTVSGVSLMQLVFPVRSQEPLKRQSRTGTDQFFSTRQRRWTCGENSDDRENEIGAAFGHTEG